MRPLRRYRWFLACAAGLSLFAAGLLADCPLGWTPGFDPRGGLTFIDLQNVGTGPALYCSSTARWNGNAYETYSPIVFAPTYCFAFHDDGAGSQLYAGGGFVSVSGQLFYKMARWNGVEWSPVGGGIPNVPNVRTLATFEHAGGSALYAGVGDYSPNILEADALWQWDGIAWTPVARFASNGGSWGLYALHVHDDGRGPALYVAGEFSAVNDLTAWNIARYDGQAWESLEVGVGRNASGGGVYALTSFDEDAGGPAPPRLFAGGDIATSGPDFTNELNGLARWDGQHWSQLGPGFPGQVPGASRPRLYALEVHDDGSGPALYAGGQFRYVAGIETFGIARWNGQQWSGLQWPGIFGRVDALESFPHSSGPRLYVGGQFDSAGAAAGSNFVWWQNDHFSSVGDGQGLAGGIAYSARVLDDGSGPALYAAGAMQAAGPLAVQGVARWDGSAWTAFGPMPDFPNSVAFDVAVFDDGGGPALYAAGQFHEPTTLDSYIVRHDPAGWTQQPGTFYMENFPISGPLEYGVNALCAWNDGAGPALYAGGTFFDVEGLPGTNRIARWDGELWSGVGGGVSAASMQPVVGEFIEYDDGRGPALYAAGIFDQIGGVTANHIARWDGVQWESLAGGVTVSDSYERAQIAALAVYDSGDGPELIAAGIFNAAGGVPTRRIARWNGQVWRPLGGGLGGSSFRNTGSGVWSLAVFDDGRGPALYASGSFEGAGGASIRNFARWDGQDWTAPPNSGEFFAFAMTAFNDARGDGLYVAYISDGNPATADPGIARYGCLDTQIPGDLDCDGRVTMFDIDPFIIALFDPAAYEAAFPTCRFQNADLNADALVNFFDIDPFLAFVLAACG